MRRALNTRLDAPITPGSTITERALAQSANAATQVQYGPQEQELQRALGIAQTQQRDTGSFYDDYQKQLQLHAANVAGYQAGAQNALAQTAQQITGLAGQQQGALQQQANTQAAQQGGATASNMAPTANAAEVNRQSILQSFQAQQAAQGAAAQNYADARANFVAPAQKLQAQAQAQQKVTGAQQKITDLKALEGKYNQQYRAEQRASEAKNVLAGQSAEGKITSAEKEGRLTRESAERIATGGVKSRETIAKGRVKVDMARVRADKAKADAAAAKADTKRADSGPFAA